MANFRFGNTLQAPLDQTRQNRAYLGRIAFDQMQRGGVPDLSSLIQERMIRETDRPVVADPLVDPSLLATPFMAAGSLATKSPFLQRLLGRLLTRSQPQRNILPTVRKGDFDVFPPTTDAQVKGANRFINRYLDQFSGGGISNAETRAIDRAIEERKRRTVIGRFD